MRKHPLKVILPVLALTLMTSAAEFTNNSKITAEENAAPLSPDIASKRMVLIKNKEGKGIANVKVIVDYDSERHPPTFSTDSEGKAEVKVKAGFMLLRVDAGDGDIRMTFRASQVEWPFEIILPTRKIRF